MAEFSVKIYCPECYTVINARLSELRIEGSMKCPKCTTNIRYSRDDLTRVRKELEKLEETIKQFEIL
jgi:RNase P subunit RPR2